MNLFVLTNMIEKELIDLPLEEGKTYKTKFATGESFTISKILKDKKGNPIKLEGVYENAKHLSDCPLNMDRLIPEKELTGKVIRRCDNCSHEIN